MSESSDRSGYLVSGAMHGALIGLIVFGLSRAPKFEDAPESIPVEALSQTQFNEVMKGERDAKPAKAPIEPPRRLAAIEPAPAPTPPPPPPEIRRVEETPTPPPPAPRPTPPKPLAPQPKPAAEAAPAPPVKPKIVEQSPEKPRETTSEKPKADAPARPASKAYDPNAIAKLIKTADATSTGATAQGLPNAHAQRMSPSLSAALDSWLKDEYMNCWSPPPGLPEGEPYIAEIHVEFNPDGSLAGRPVLMNPPQSHAWRAHAESAMRAALKCDPLHVPPQFAPYFEQWKSKTIHFDPQDSTG